MYAEFIPLWPEERIQNVIQIPMKSKFHSAAQQNMDRPINEEI